MPSEQTLNASAKGTQVVVNPGQYDLPHTVKAPEGDHISGLPEFVITNALVQTVFTKLDGNAWEVGEQNPNLTVPDDDRTAEQRGGS